MISRFAYSVVVLSTLILFGCSNPNNIRFGSDPSEDMEKNAKLLDKLPPEDLTLLNSYVVLYSESAKASGKPNPVVGKTVGEVLLDAKAWQKAQSATAVAQRAREAEEKKQAEQVSAEEKDLRDKVANIVTVTFDKRTVAPAPPGAMAGQQLLRLEYDITNKGGKPILALKGKAVFKDPAGKVIAEHPFTSSKTVPAGGRIRVVVEYPVSSASSPLGDLAKAGEGKFIFSFVPDGLILEGGETLTLPPKQ